MKKNILLFTSLVSILLLGASCSSSNKNLENITETVTNTQPTNEIVKQADCKLAVSNDQLYFYTSPDGLAFTQKAFIQDLSSVPNLYYDATQNNYILTFQSFEQTSNLCDKLAYVRLSLGGEVLESPQPIRIESSKYFTGFDPTLVSVQDKLVLVYTVRPQGKKFPCISLAVAKGLDISDGFTGLDQIVWCSEGDTENFMDPSAVVAEENGQPYLYIYIPSDLAMASSTPVSYIAKVDISSADPTDWEITSSETITGAGLFLLGEMVDDPENSTCPFAFYGTAQNTIKRTCSADGLTFTQAPHTIFSGADPAVTKAPDGSFVLVYASDN